MIPVWDFILERLHFPFQLLSATMGIEFLHIVGIPAFRSGIYIELPKITLEVAEACSGINYLISIIAIGIPLSYLYLRKPMKRIFLISTAVLIAIISNGLRVALIGVFAFYGYRELHGPFAIFRAVVISSVGIIVLFVLAWVFSDRKKKVTVNIDNVNPEIHYSKAKSHKKNDRGIFPMLMVLFPFIVVGSYINFHKPNIVPLKSNFTFFPYRIGKWTGMDTDTDFTVFQELGVDHELSRMYKSASGHAVNLYMGYFEYQEQGRELINYRINYLFKKNSTITIALEGGKELTINKFIGNRGRSKKLVFYWFDINGRILTNKYLVKLYHVWDGIVHNRTNGSVIIITTEIGDKEEIDGSLLMGKKFIRDLHSVLYYHLPRI
jgi:EpsI family protein